MKLSIVSTLYKSEPYIEEFCRRILACATAITHDFEIVLVNDGSPDHVLDKCKALINEGLPVRVIDLTRNFGHHKAMLTGLRVARGDYVFLIDCDLEESPEWLSQFWETMHEASVDVVYGVQRSRKGGFFERHVNGLYYLLFNALSDVEIPRNLLVVRLMKRSFVNHLMEYRETDVVFAALCSLAGHKQQAFEVNKGHKKSTTYNFTRKLAMIVNSIVSFSARPLEILFGLGLCISSLSVLVTIVLFYLRFVKGNVLEGWTSILISIWLLGGLILTALGLIGIYLSRVFYQVKMRPLTLVQGDYYDAASIGLHEGHVAVESE